MIQELKNKILLVKNILPQNILSLNQFSRPVLEDLFELADLFSKSDPVKTKVLLAGKVAATLFYQPSTRTRLNFHSAILRLGASVIGFSDPVCTRAGDYYCETLDDVIQFTGQICDIIILRHYEDGAAARVSAFSPVPLINAGDGYNEHPTQALGDIWTMYKALKGFENKTIGLVGDLSIRSLRSILIGLSKFPIKRFLFLFPNGVSIKKEVEEQLSKDKICYRLADDIDEIIENADIIETVGINHSNYNLQWAQPASHNKTADRYRITAEKLKEHNKAIPILHPGPRTDEVAIDVDRTKNAFYFKQANNGMWMRMAVLSALLYESK